MDKNLEHSIQIQDKFQFYFLALVFTVLGLSIQTSQFSTKIQAVFEIGAWLSFLVSGLAGLSKMEWVSVAYKHYSNLTVEKSFAREAKNGRRVIGESGQLLSDEQVAQYIKRANERIRERANIMEKIETHDNIKYFLHKWLFVAGLALLIISRAVNLYSSSHSPAG